MDDDDEFEGEELHEDRWADDEEYDDDFTYHNEDTWDDDDGVARKVCSPPQACSGQSVYSCHIASHTRVGAA